jgi:hypothetical protein
LLLANCFPGEKSALGTKVHGEAAEVVSSRAPSSSTERGGAHLRPLALSAAGCCSCCCVLVVLLHCC